MDSTCLIGIQNIFGQIEYIAVTSDGEGVGKVLHEQYKTRPAVAALIRGGSRPFLEGPGDILNEDDIQESSKMVRTHQDFFAIQMKNLQYYYLFTTDNSWIIYSFHLEPNFQHENMLYD